MTCEWIFSSGDAMSGTARSHWRTAALSRFDTFFFVHYAKERLLDMHFTLQPGAGMEPTALSPFQGVATRSFASLPIAWKPTACSIRGDSTRAHVFTRTLPSSATVRHLRNVNYENRVQQVAANNPAFGLRRAGSSMGVALARNTAGVLLSVTPNLHAFGHAGTARPQRAVQHRIASPHGPGCVWRMVPNGTGHPPGGAAARWTRSRPSLLSFAFAGKLVPQATNHEPTEKLLKRIHASPESKSSRDARKQPGHRTRTDRVPSGTKEIVCLA
jgi:hypothetical protein